MIKKFSVITFCSLMVGILCVVAKSGSSKFDYFNYSSALLDSNYKGRLDHFPLNFNSKLIPLAYVHQIPILQGGGRIQVICKYTDSPNFWSIYDGKFKYTSNGIGMEYISNGKDLTLSLPLVTCLVPGYTGQLDVKWKIGVLNAIKGKDHDNQPWNHGDTHGIAINESLKLILFYAETW